MSERPALSTSRGKQISVFLDDKPGALAGVTLLLGEHGVNVFALSLAEGIDHGYVRMVVDHHDQACRLLKENGFLFFEKDILLLEIPNRPGALGRVARTWGSRGINVEYAYCAGGPGVESGLIVVRVSDADGALAALA